MLSRSGITLPHFGPTEDWKGNRLARECSHVESWEGLAGAARLHLERLRWVSDSLEQVSQHSPRPLGGH
jgi:hypothetical protein